MRRLIVLAAVVLTTAAVMAATAAALPNDTRKPCVDIVDGNFAYRVDGVVGGSVRLAAAACKGAKFTLYVLEESGDTTPLATAAGTETQVPEVVRFDTASLTTEDTDVCIYVEARNGKPNTDRAPDTGCVELIKEGSPGGGGMN